MKDNVIYISGRMLEVFIAIIGYLSPAKGAIHIMVAAIVIDYVVGLIAAKKRGNEISKEKSEQSIYKLLFSIAIVLMVYIMDVETGFAGIITHRAIAWLITASEIFSIAANMAEMTNHRLWRLIQKLANKKINEATGVDLEKEENLNK